MVYARKVDGQELTFVVSGMLWRNSLILMDQETETLWSHVTGEALRGPLAGKRLQALPVVHTTWKKWRTTHPDTQLLKKDRSVTQSQYESYHADPDKFGLSRAKTAIEKLPGKSLIHGTVVDGKAVAIADGAIGKDEKREIKVAERTIHFRRTADGGVRAFETKSGKELPVTVAYWFAWISFYPNSQLVE